MKDAFDLGVIVCVCAALLVHLILSFQRLNMLWACEKASETQCELVAMPTKTADRVTP